MGTHPGQPYQPLFNRGPRTSLWITICLLALLVILIWKASVVLLLLFASVLLALLLRGLSRWLSTHSRLSYRWSLAIVVLSHLGLLAAVGWFIVPELGEQATQLQADLPRAFKQLQERIGQHELGAQALNAVQSVGAQAQADNLLPKASGALHSIAAALGGVLLLIFVALYLAADPRRYVMALVRLFSLPKRPRAQQVLHVLGGTLQRWLVGRLVLMTINGVVTTLGLWAMQIPLALALGILSGLLNFIPNFGPIIAAIPAVLVAFLEGPDKALYVIIFYLVYQNIDGYILEPQVEKRTVSLPPVVTIVAQVLLGLLLGTMGVLLAAPCAAIILVVLKMCYLEDVLGESITLPTDGKHKDGHHASSESDN